MCTVTTTREGHLLDTRKSAPRFEPRTGWATLPVQPPAGTWQLRAARVYPVLVATFAFLAASAFVAHRNSATLALFWTLLAIWMVQCAFFGVVAIRGGLLERRERKLGYTTWARKR
jgi:hypothetical protein